LLLIYLGLCSLITGYLMQFILAGNLLGLPAISVPVSKRVSFVDSLHAFKVCVREPALQHHHYTSLSSYPYSSSYYVIYIA